MVAEAVTDTQELQAITDALALIDLGLSSVLHRELVSSDEVADLLLDLRMLLAPFNAAALDETELLAPN
jgi:hypothetical protein